MKTTAREMASWSRLKMNELAKLPRFGSGNKVCKHISNLSGLSISLVQKFYYGDKPNLTIESLDALILAIKATDKK